MRLPEKDRSALPLGPKRTVTSVGSEPGSLGTSSESEKNKKTGPPTAKPCKKWGGFFCFYEGCDNFFSTINININIYAAKEGGRPFGFCHCFLPLFLGTASVAIPEFPFKRQIWCSSNWSASP
jgi:hypothetical protein